MKQRRIPLILFHYINGKLFEKNTLTAAHELYKYFELTFVKPKTSKGCY